MKIMFSFIAWVQLAATIAIAFFAFRTWQATKLYAKVAGLQTAGSSGMQATEAELAPKLHKAILKILMKDFPEEFKELEPHLR